MSDESFASRAWASIRRPFAWLLDDIRRLSGPLRPPREGGYRPDDPRWLEKWETRARARRARNPRLVAEEAAWRAAWEPIPCPFIGEWPADGPRIGIPSTPTGATLDPKSRDVWDDWWRERMAEHSPPVEVASYYEVVRPLLPFLRRREAPRVLSVACGVSLEVRAFAAAGVACTGMDVSPVAIEFARIFTPRQGDARGLEHFLSPMYFRDGGSCDWVVGDVFDASACPGPYDAIVVRKFLQYCWRAGHIDEVVVRLRDRLAPDGVLVVTSHNDARGPVEESLLRNGFAWQWNARVDLGHSIPDPPPGHRLAITCYSSG